jgi:hypothetical protein
LSLLRVNRIRVVCCVAGLLVAGIAIAQEHRWEISPEGGYLFGGSIISDHDADGKKITGGLEDAGVYGLRAAFVANPNLEFEVEAVRCNTHFSLERATSLNVSPFRVDYLIGSGAYRFKIGDSAASLGYLSLGAGAGRFEPSHGVTVTRFTGALGAGFKRFLFPGLGFRLDGRLYASPIEGANLGEGCTVANPNSPAPSPSRPCNQQSWLVNVDVTAGIVIGF